MRLRVLKKKGSETTCETTEKMTRRGRDLSYSNPIIQLPTNQKAPNPALKMPKAVPRRSLDTMVVTADFRMDSCAPMPMPQNTTPVTAKAGALKRNTNGANSMDIAEEMMIAVIPFRSYMRPKKSAESASTPIATE